MVYHGGKNIKDKDLEGVKAIILEVASIHVTLYDHRLDFLRSKKDSKSHSDFLRELEEKIDLCDFQNWSSYKMVGTLFLTFCDVEMGKVLTELLSKPALDMGEMRARVGFYFFFVGAELLW